MKEKVTINDQIANTLFIPLYMRFKDSSPSQRYYERPPRL